MQVVLQRVKQARVVVDGTISGEIGRGLLALVGIAEEDDAATIDWITRKICDLRIFSDSEGRLAHSVREINGSLLSVSQFTLLADTKKGTRPSFTRAAKGEKAHTMWQSFNQAIEAQGIPIEAGVFGAYMEVSLVNDGPVTIILER